MCSSNINCRYLWNNSNENHPLVGLASIYLHTIHCVSHVHNQTQNNFCMQKKKIRQKEKRYTHRACNCYMAKALSKAWICCCARVWGIGYNSNNIIKAFWAYRALHANYLPWKHHNDYVCMCNKIKLYIVWENASITTVRE